MADTEDPFGTALRSWRQWQATPWGRLRYVLAEAHVVRHLGGGEDDVTPRTVLDLGGGDGGDAVRLAARGHRVTLVDQSSGMLAAGRERAREAGVGDLVECVEADVLRLPEAVGAGRFDAVLCHNVIQYLDDPAAVLRAAVAPLRPGGVLSVMAINRHSAALLAAVREQDPAAALAALDDRTYRTMTFDTPVRLYAADELVAELRRLGCSEVYHYGIRAFCDYITDDVRKRDPEYFAQIERLERAASDRAPFKHTARIFQLVARKP